MWYSLLLEAGAGQHSLVDLVDACLGIGHLVGMGLGDEAERVSRLLGLDATWTAALVLTI